MHCNTVHAPTTGEQHPYFTALTTQFTPLDIYDKWNEPVPDILMDSAVAGLQTSVMATAPCGFDKPPVLVVNLFSGPCGGKSTNAALLFGKLKIAGVNAELVSEYAKDLTWEKRHSALGFQPYVTAKQLWRVARLRDEVEVIITDSPFILGLAYPGWGSTPSFAPFILEVFDLFHNYNVFLARGENAHPYNPTGRTQNEEQAKDKDREILGLLRQYELEHEVVQIGHGEETANYLRDRVLQILSNRQIAK